MKIKNKIFIIAGIFLLILIALSFINISKKSTFRHISLGMTKEKVFEIESKKNNCDNIEPLFDVYCLKNAKYDKYKGNIVYTFYNDSLKNISFEIENAYKEDYEYLKEILKKTI